MTTQRLKQILTCVRYRNWRFDAKSGGPEGLPLLIIDKRSQSKPDSFSVQTSGAPNEDAAGLSLVLAAIATTEGYPDLGPIFPHLTLDFDRLRELGTGIFPTDTIEGFGHRFPGH
jgi:hypothetical protein